MRPSILAAAVLLLFPVLLSGCATPGDRVSDALIEAGVSRGPARCFGRDLTATVHPADLDRIADAVSAARVGGRQMTLAEAAGFAQSVDDPLTLVAIVAAATRCAG